VLLAELLAVDLIGLLHIGLEPLVGRQGVGDGLLAGRLSLTQMLNLSTRGQRLMPQGFDLLVPAHQLSSKPGPHRLSLVYNTHTPVVTMPRRPSIGLHVHLASQALITTPTTVTHSTKLTPTTGQRGHGGGRQSLRN